MSLLTRQERSRHRIRDAALSYARLRAATGTHTDTVRAQLRDGTPVEVLITLELVPTADPERPAP